MAGSQTQWLGLISLINFYAFKESKNQMALNKPTGLPDGCNINHILNQREKINSTPSLNLPCQLQTLVGSLYKSLT